MTVTPGPDYALKGMTQGRAQEKVMHNELDKMPKTRARKALGSAPEALQALQAPHATCGHFCYHLSPLTSLTQQ